MRKTFDKPRVLCPIVPSLGSHGQARVLKSDPPALSWLFAGSFLPSVPLRLCTGTSLCPQICWISERPISCPVWRLVVALAQASSLSFSAFPALPAHSRSLGEPRPGRWGAITGLGGVGAGSDKPPQMSQVCHASRPPSTGHGG